MGIIQAHVAHPDVNIEVAAPRRSRRFKTAIPGSQVEGLLLVD